MHLHPDQLSKDVLETIHDAGVVVHAWEVNTQNALETIVELDIPRICTDQFDLAADFRKQTFA